MIIQKRFDKAASVLYSVGVRASEVSDPKRAYGQGMKTMNNIAWDVCEGSEGGFDWFVYAGCTVIESGNEDTEEEAMIEAEHHAEEYENGEAEE